MPGRDPYAVLGVNREASQAEVRRAYRKLARKYHPDVNPGDPRAAETFKQVAGAYQILGDPKQRDRYDRTGGADPEGVAAASAPGIRFDGFDFADPSGSPFAAIFSDLFSRRPSRPEEPRRGADLQYPIRVSFEEAFRGREATVHLERLVPCGDCGGTGHRREGGSRTCPVCDGSGRRERRAGFMRFATPCDSCAGRGRVLGTICSACRGEGVRPDSDRIRVRIPPGVDGGSQVRVAGKGNAGSRGGPPGDLFLLVEVEPHPFFRRLGDNLYCEIPITFPEAALGTKVRVPTLEGSATIRILPGTQSGQKIRLRERGFPSLRSGAHGDLFVEVRVVTPRVRDERSREILREFERLNAENLRPGGKAPAETG
ncbi:MAG: J domain-containing protein [Acidobacteria bacterium]|nr:J domain-containing protein [Acidobacteriota bacterium]